jgi:hypothetical protein
MAAPDPSPESPQESDVRSIGRILIGFAVVVLVASGFGVGMHWLSAPEHARYSLISFGVLLAFGVLALLVFVPSLGAWIRLPIMLVVAPLFVWRMRSYHPIDHKSIETIPPEIAQKDVESFTACRQSLERAGFVANSMHMCSVMAYSDGTRARGIVQRFEHTTSRHVAEVILHLPKVPGAAASQSVMFFDYLPDGSRILTSNADLPSVYPRLAVAHTIQLPLVRDPAELYRVHLGMIARFAPGFSPPGMRGDPLGGMLEREADFHDRMVRGGYRLPTGREGEFRHDWRMTLRMAWGLMPPIGKLRARAMRRKNQRRRAEWGL